MQAPSACIAGVTRFTLQCLYTCPRDVQRKGAEGRCCQGRIITSAISNVRAQQWPWLGRKQKQMYTISISIPISISVVVVARAAIISKTIVCCIYYRCCVSRAAKTRIPATSRRDCGHELAVKAAAAGVVLSVTACPWARPPPLTAGAAGSGNCAPPRACTGRRWPPTASGALNSSPETPLANGSGSSRSTPAMCVPSLLLCLSTSCLALLPGRPHRLRESPSGCCSYFVFIRRYIVSTLTASKSGLFLAVHILCPACQHLTP